MEVTDRERALGEELTALRARLAAVEEQAAAKELQLRKHAAAARDAYPGKHAERVAAYGLEIARALGSQMAYDPEIEFGFLLHDIGKVAIPDAILYKPEPLNEAER